MQLIEDIAPYRHLGIEPPPLQLLITRVHPVSSNARLIQQSLRDLFQGQVGLRVLDTDVPAIEAYPRAATRGLPVHRVEYLQPTGRVAPAAPANMRSRRSQAPHVGQAFVSPRRSRWSPSHEKPQTHTAQHRT